MYTFLAQEIMKNLLNDLPMSLADLVEVVKAKAIEVGVLHDGLLSTITLFAVCYLMVVFAGHLWKNINRKNGKFKRVFTRSMSMAVLHGGELALERLVQFHEARANFQLLDDDNSGTELVSLLNEALPDLKKLQRCVAKLEMSGKESKAVEKLETAVREARSKGKPHEAYEFEMLLVETLIYKGDFKKALSYRCLNDQYISDARRPLYKAIIYLSLGNTEEAQNCWADFKRIRKLMKRSGNAPDAQLFEITKNFTKFKCVVESLKEDIKEAKANAK